MPWGVPIYCPYTVDSTKSSASPAHPSTQEETPHGCIAGAVYIGYLVEDEHGEEVEDFETVPCRRCGAGDE